MIFLYTALLLLVGVAHFLMKRRVAIKVIRLEHSRDAAGVPDPFIDQVTESGRYCLNGGSRPIDRVALVLEPIRIAAEHALVSGHRVHGLVPLLGALHHALEPVPHLRRDQFTVSSGVSEQDLGGFPCSRTCGALACDLTDQLAQ